jgi:TolB-like protein/Tfp pilus assembly protein PilF
MAGASSLPGQEALSRNASDRLDSWKEIAAYLKREIRTVQRWEKSLGLPVHRLGDQQGVFAYKLEIDAWWRDRETKISEEDAQASSAAGPTAPDLSPTRADSDSQIQGNQTQSFLQRQRYFLLAVALGIVLGAIGLRIFWPRMQGRASAPMSRVTLGVVPFKNLSGDPDAQSIAEALTEETISELGRLHPHVLSVIGLPPSTAAAPRGQIAAAVKTDYLLQGTVRRAGQRVAVTAQLIWVKDQAGIWGDSYERELQNPEDIIPIEIEVANSLSNQVLSQLPHDNQPAGRVNREAYEAYLEGRFFWNKRTAGSLTKAVAYFQKAIQFDPTYAPAYAGLADTYSLLGSAPYSALPPKQAWPIAEAAARKALELDSSLSEAHVSLGYAELVYDWKFSDAEKEFQEAIRLRPAYPTAHQYYGYYLTVMGRLNEAITERQTARELEPLSPLLHSALGEAYYQNRQFELTIEQNQKSLELDPSYEIALVNLGRAYEQEHKYDLALEAFRKILAAAPEDPAVLALIGHAEAVSGRRSDALQIVSKLQRIRGQIYVPALYFAMIYTGLNDKDKAFEWLGKAFEERCEYLVYLPTEPMADSLRSDPRFTKLLNHLGLKPAKTVAAISTH